MSAPPMPQTIAVDLTPVLPGGDNGGAKVLALALVRSLAAALPDSRFVLLTQASSHEELAALDASNVRRVMTVGNAAAGARTQLFALASRVLAHCPHFVRRIAARAGYGLHAMLKRPHGAGPVAAVGADLLFCPFTAPTYRERGVPVVSTLYDLQFAEYPQFFTVEDALLRERAFHAAMRDATRLAAISDFSRAAAARAAGDDAGKIRTVLLRLPPPSSPASGDSAVLARHGLESGAYLLYPANFWKHKNHEVLLAAFALALREGLPATTKLVFSGAPGARMEWMRRAAAALGLADRVVFAGFLPPAEFAMLLRRARALVFPSLYEGFGLPVVEAMATGVPVACSRVTALPEVAGDAAHYFDPRDPRDVARALVAIAGNETLRSELTARGRLRARELTDVGRMTGEYLALFGEALAEKGAA